jgi:hypothetical protein
VNYQLFHAINGLTGRWPRIDWVMRFAAVQLVFVVVAVAGVLVIHAVLRRQIRRLTCLGVSLLLAIGLSQGLERLSHQVRHFPGHPVHPLVAPATAAFAVAFGILLFLDRRAGLALTAAAVLIGVAQVWTGRQYPGDILSGAAIAGLSAFSVYVTDLGARDVQRRTGLAPGRL